LLKRKRAFTFCRCMHYTNIRALNFNVSADIRAFLAQLKGRINTFLYGDPDYLVLGPRGTFSGTPLVAGAAQTGESLNVDGFTALQTNVARAGDYIQLDTGAASELYMIVADVNSDSAGAATLTLNRPLLSAPANNEVVVSTNARGVFKLIDNSVEWSSNKSSVTEVTFAFKEAL